MEIKRVALVLADISGYTNFMKMHTMSLIHAEAIVTELLEAVIDRAEHPLTLSKLEGDAVFLYATLSDDEPAALRDVTRQVTAFFEAFKIKERALIACDACRCDACSNIAQLKLKVFLHVGQAAFKKIRQFEELGGEDVILIHRLLKNTIPTKEYILMTQTFYQSSGGLPGQQAEARTEDCEGIGPVGVQVFYPTSDEAPLPERPAPAPPQAGTEFGKMADRWNDYAVRRLLGRQERPAFSNFQTGQFTPLDLWNYFVLGIAGNIVATIQYQFKRRSAKQEADT